MRASLKSQVRDFRRSVASCIAGSFVLRLASSATGVMLGLYLAHIDATVYQIPATTVGIIGASFFITELLGAPVFGAQSDRFGFKLFMILGPLFGFIAVQMTAATTLLWVLFITRLLEGLSTASSTPSTLGYISTITASPEPANGQVLVTGASSARLGVLRGRIVSYFEVASIAGLALGYLAGGVLWDWLKAWGFVAVGGIYLTSLLIYARGVDDVREKNPQATAGLGHYLRLFRSHRLLILAPAWLCFNAIFGLWLNHVAFQMSGDQTFPDQVLTGGFSGSAVGSILASYAITFVVGIYLWSFAFGRIRKTTIMVIGTLGIFAVVALVFAINHAGNLRNPALVPLGLLALVAVAVQSGFTPAGLAYLADISQAFEGDRGAIMGLYSVLLGIGQLLGAWLGGPFAQRGGMDGIIALSAIFALFSLATVLLLRREEERERVAVSS
ncbi:MAG: MFS transporter [Chloroflexota bacterium]